MMSTTFLDVKAICLNPRDGGGGGGTRRVSLSPGSGSHYRVRAAPRHPSPPSSPEINPVPSRARFLSGAAPQPLPAPCSPSRPRRGDVPESPNPSSSLLWPSLHSLPPWDGGVEMPEPPFAPRMCWGSSSGPPRFVWGEVRSHLCQRLPRPCWAPGWAFWGDASPQSLRRGS